jgi:hypothetical protein
MNFYEILKNALNHLVSKTEYREPVQYQMSKFCGYKFQFFIFKCEIEEFSIFWA